ncbi:MAG: type II secretion system major pseudopilin GspG [Spirochaetes bacterium]|nr:type II secretion system major pseudopilin GspG [Spirochaetota bacterium]
MSGIKGNGGFTLIELMIVIAIIGILSIIVVPRFMDIPQKARVEAAKQQIAAFGLALDRYNLDNGTYPTTEQGLAALIERPNSEPAPMNYNEGGYLKKKELPKDPWGRDYIYRSPGDHGNDYEIMSLGADGRDGGEGVNADIRSW